MRSQTSRKPHADGSSSSHQNSPGSQNNGGSDNDRSPQRSHSRRQNQTFSWPKAAASLPHKPGVYWFVDAAGQILYIGKAKNLRNRVRTYTRTNQLRPKIQAMVKQAEQLKFEVLESELQALLIEAELIRLHQPEFNVLQKDDKSPVYVHIPKGVYPPVKLVRRQKVYQQGLSGTVLGPFKSSYKLKQVLRLARKIFGWCDRAQSKLPANIQKQSNQAQDYLQQRHQACFYQHLDLCPGACIGQISPQEYRQHIDQLVLFLRGKKQAVISQLTKKMKLLADQQKFEQAAAIKRKIQLIRDVTQKKFKLKPDLILPALHDSQTKNSLDHLRKILNDFLDLPRQYRLKRIEGYDVSNIQGKNAAVSMVAFRNGMPDKSNYRLFNIRGLDTPNDYQMLKEAIVRRQKHPEWGKPQLLVIDGGKGQLRAALSVWEWGAPVISMAKDPDRIIVPRKHYRDPNTNRLKIEYEVVRLPADHPTLHLVQHIRDESHRFAKKQHSRLRRRNLLE